MRHASVFYFWQWDVSVINVFHWSQSVNLQYLCKVCVIEVSLQRIPSSVVPVKQQYKHLSDRFYAVQKENMKRLRSSWREIGRYWCSNGIRFRQHLSCVSPQCRSLKTPGHDGGGGGGGGRILPNYVHIKLELFNNPFMETGKKEAGIAGCY